MNWTTFWQLWLTMLFCFGGSFLLAALMISAVTQQINTMIDRRFGERVVDYLALFGVIVHELSHAIMAFIFRHDVDKIQLFQRGKVNDDGYRTRGYVSHSWRPDSFYQQMGNMMIGLAPMFGITAMGFGLTWWLWPELLDMNRETWVTMSSWWQLPLLFILLISLVLGLKLSRSDWQGVRNGLPQYVLVLTVITIIVWFMKISAEMVWLTIGSPLVLGMLGLLGIAIIVYVSVWALTR
ncbi:hypothetical protein OIT44_04905 [Weissella ceti]|uniref:Integral membrane protein n=1 Tax=Weissella ceti TaxID=759620 RepID=A0ABT3E4T0_9LACO|nr:hypothetical protein [Weissella ceti]MCW0953411.1 hypothetical protein [Weissella ceti]QVK12014.1 hypothetical protein KHQ31_07350 [Weissella ceti]